MSVVLVCQGLATTGVETPEGLIGQYLESFDVDAHDGRGTATWTNDLNEAIVFDGFMQAMEAWRTWSTVRMFRDDGQPNRPLTAFHVEPRAL